MHTTEKPNRLINEKSPYLLQHANNPVDWYSWGEEAFSKAKEEDKPVFLSIGYSSCHWCHRMREESFEDQEVADLLNRYFVCIKVDREERPDIDHLYMDFCQAMTGRGGWPMSIFMTPEQKPFYAGTYIPKHMRYDIMGLIQLAQGIHDAWENDREKILQSSEEILEFARTTFHVSSKEHLDKEVVNAAYSELHERFDEKNGGFGTAPKFPTPHNLFFLLRFWKQTGSAYALEMVEKSLIGIYRGGIFDHIGFGFSRYSVDERWLVPHFEKMLYDNALLAIAYLEAWQVTGKPLYREVAEKVFAYVLRDMTSPEGAFYSAEDADSEGVEGKFYVWTKGEIEAVLGAVDTAWFSGIYHVTEEGNFEEKNILNLIGTDFEELEQPEVRDRLENLREVLYRERSKRVYPLKDDKVLTSWNGLMIAALAYGGRVLGNTAYLEAAEKAAAFILERLTDGTGRLLASYRENEARHLGYLDDYAFMIFGLIELHQGTLKQSYLEKALELSEEMVTLFWDRKDGGFFLSGNDGERLLIRGKNIDDSALPSGNAMAAMDFLRLFSLTGRNGLREKAEELFHAFGGTVKEQPSGFTYLLSAFMLSQKAPMELVIAGRRKDEETGELFRAFQERYLPFATVLLQDPDTREGLPDVFWREPLDDKATAYVCRDFACQMGVTDVDSLVSILEEDARGLTKEDLGEVKRWEEERIEREDLHKR